MIASVAATFVLALLVQRLVTHRWKMSPWLMLAVALPPVPWPGPHFEALMLVLLFVVSWQAATSDVDLGADDPLWNERLFLLVSGVVAAWHPLAMLPALWVMLVRFDAFKHHALLPFRLLFVGVAFVVAHALGLATESAALIVMLACHALVYVIAAHTKASLGPHWYSWPQDNRIHHLMASAYSWGWAHFLGNETWCRLVRAARPFDRPMQWSTMILESAFLFELLHPALARILMCAAIVFHLAVFLTSGILFWELMVTNAALIWFIATAGIDHSFGAPAFCAGLFLMALFWRSGPAWRPLRLGWWDTPFTQRVHWQVVGKSGQVYGLHNDFLCPHERLYGQIHGRFFTKRKFCTQHLGEVMHPALRDALRDPASLAATRRLWGMRYTNPALAARERAYLRRLFTAFNAGRRKHVLPRGLRWLKAPGGQCFYWGALPAFRGQEAVSSVRLFYREEYFDGRRFLNITDEALADIEITSARGEQTPGAVVLPAEENPSHATAR